jgi:hypothetical protein
VVTPRLVPRNRAKRISANAIGHKPLARFGGFEIAADVAAEIDHGWNHGAGTIEWTTHTEIMELPWQFSQQKYSILGRCRSCGGTACRSTGPLPGSFMNVNAAEPEMCDLCL